MRTHGLASTYRRGGCRCRDCTTAHSLRYMAELRQRRERLAADPSLAPHGMSSTYRNWGCRCTDCTTAHGAACRAYEADPDRSAATTTAARKEAVDRAIALMRKDLAAELTVPDLAKAAGYTKWHLTHVFKQVTGTSPARYLTRLRVQEACRLLAETDLSVADIVAAVGRNSVGGFGTMFKVHVGCAPTAYRAQARAKAVTR